MALHCFRALGLLPLLSLTVTATAHARGPAPPYEPLDDGRDRDVEPERWGPHAAGFSGPRTSAYLALGVHLGLARGAAPDFGGLVLLGVPLDRIAAPRGPIVPAPNHDLGDPAAAGTAPWGLAEESAPVAPVKAPSVPEPITLSPELARGCVAAAWRTAGLADEHRIDALASRARASAALPELRLRAARTVDQSGRVTLSEVDTSRYTEAGGDTYWLEARLTFRLDRLLFADEEVSLERIRLDRTEARARIAAKALKALFEWQRAELLSQDPNLKSDDHLSAVLSEIEAAAVLDVLTDGWFARARAGARARP